MKMTATDWMLLFDRHHFENKFYKRCLYLSLWSLAFFSIPIQYQGTLEIFHSCKYVFTPCLH